MDDELTNNKLLVLSKKEGHLSLVADVLIVHIFFGDKI